MPDFACGLRGLARPQQSDDRSLEFVLAQFACTTNPAGLREAAQLGRVPVAVLELRYRHLAREFRLVCAACHRENFRLGYYPRRRAMLNVSRESEASPSRSGARRGRGRDAAGASAAAPGFSGASPPETAHRATGMVGAMEIAAQRRR